MTRNKLTSNLHKKLFFLLILLLPTQLGLHFWPDWASVFGIRVDYLSPTIYLTDLLVMGIIISWFLSDRPKLSAIRHLLYAIVYLLATSLLVAQNHGVALYKLAKLIEFSLLGFYVARNYTSYTISHKLAKPLSAAMVYSCVLAWIQFLTGHTAGLWILGERSFDVNAPGIALVNIGGVDYLRSYATFPHPNVLAGFLLLSLFIIRLPWQVRALAISTIVITFSHSAWIAGLLAIVFLSTQWFKDYTKIFTQNAFLGAIILSLAFPLLTKSIDTANLPEEIGRRIDLSQVVMAMAANYPVTGVGLGNFIVRLPEYGGSPNVSWWLQPVHNIFLLILSEIGLIGLGFVIWFLLSVFKKMENGKWKLEIPLLVILITGMADHYWLTLQQGQLLTSIVVGLVLSATINYRRQERR